MQKIPPPLNPIFIELWNSDKRFRIGAFLIKQIATSDQAGVEWAKSAILKVKKMSPINCTQEFFSLLQSERPDLYEEFKEFIEIDETDSLESYEQFRQQIIRSN